MQTAEINLWVFQP